MRSGSVAAAAHRARARWLPVATLRGFWASSSAIAEADDAPPEPLGDHGGFTDVTVRSFRARLRHCRASLTARERRERRAPRRHGLVPRRVVRLRALDHEFGAALRKLAEECGERLISRDDRLARVDGDARALAHEAGQGGIEIVVPISSAGASPMLASPPPPHMRRQGAPPQVASRATSVAARSAWNTMRAPVRSTRSCFATRESCAWQSAVRPMKLLPQ